MEIGGYIEFEKYNNPMLHDEAVKLNCGRNALAYLIEAKNIRAIAMPRFMCDSCTGILEKYGVHVRYYSIGLDFKPKDINVQRDEWLYLVNFYGQLSNEYIETIKKKNIRIIVDNAHAYFQLPVEGVDTLYTCRKFFGVSDGAILYTDSSIPRIIPQDFSYERVEFLLGRYERTASEFYSGYVRNNDLFHNEPIKKMSKLTENFLHGLDYESINGVRKENFQYVHERLRELNRLDLFVPEGAFMYPLYIEKGADIRILLQKRKIYVPILWPSVFELCREGEPEYDMAKNILPLPIDHRYGKKEMDIIINNLEDLCDELP